MERVSSLRRLMRVYILWTRRWGVRANRNFRLLRCLPLLTANSAWAGGGPATMNLRRPLRLIGTLNPERANFSAQNAPMSHLHR